MSKVCSVAQIMEATSSCQKKTPTVQRVGDCRANCKEGYKSWKNWSQTSAYPALVEDIPWRSLGTIMDHSLYSLAVIPISGVGANAPWRDPRGLRIGSSVEWMGHVWKGLSSSSKIRFLFFWGGWRRKWFGLVECQFSHLYDGSTLRMDTLDIILMI